MAKQRHLMWAMLALAVACAPADSPSPPAQPTDPSLPSAVSADWLDSVQRGIAASQRAIHERDGTLVATMPGVAREARFDDAGVSLTDLEGESTLTLTTLSFGRMGTSEPLVAVPPALGDCSGETALDGACIRRLEYRWDGLVEWWLALPTGLEQGWTVAVPPSGQGPLGFEVVAEGALALDADGDALAITDAAGQLWTAGSIQAWDAHGISLPTRYETVGHAFRIEVDDTGATYPLTVDPIYTTAAWTLLGSGGSEFGRLLSAAGDVNGDGFDDVLIGSYQIGLVSGAVYVYHGRAGGLASLPDAVINGAEPWTCFADEYAAVGDVDGDGYDDVMFGYLETDPGRYDLYTGSATGLGSSPTLVLTAPDRLDDFEGVHAAGDVNGDGFDDVIVHAEHADRGDEYGYVFHGSSAGLGTTPSSTLTGCGSADPFMEHLQLAGIGDVDGDGFDDVAVGDPDYASEAGRVCVFPGSAVGIATTADTQLDGAPGSEFGETPAGGGDVNGDGYDDLIISVYGGAPPTALGVFVHHGSAAGVLETASAVIPVEDDGSRLWGPTVGIGDADGDGFDDLAAQSFGESGEDRQVWVFHGSAAGVDTASAAVLEDPGDDDLVRIPEGVGDVDGDGYDDLMVGVRDYEDSTGAAFLYSGSATGPDPTASETLLPPHPFGSALVTGAGDLNGDGHPDVAIGGSSSGDGGRVYVFYGDGSTLPAIADVTLEGTDAGSQSFGRYLDSAGDVDGDGFGDLVVGASSDGGTVHLFLGSAAGLSTTSSWTVEGGEDGFLGWGLQGAGDVDGDGYDDVILGEGGYSDWMSWARLYRGGPSGLHDYDELPAYASGWAGMELAAGGDVNGDGHTDVAIGASLWNDGQGRALVHLGSPSGVGISASTTVTGEANSGTFSTVMTFCDVDGDGYDDLIVSDCLYDTDAGRIHVYPGGASGTDSAASTTITGARGDYLGLTMDCAGDVDDDGFEDLVTGGQWADDNGEVRIYTGSSSGLTTTPAVTVSSSVYNMDLGYSVAGVGDIDGDGFDDVLASASSHVFLFRGYDFDQDMDGYATRADCDDTDPAIHPGATEVCDGIDNDCDGDVDELGAEGGSPFYADDDGDGFGDPAEPATLCEATSGYVADATDCDDDDAAVHPEATEHCDGVDDDCDGAIDEEGAVGESSWYSDEDGDGWGAGEAQSACDQPDGTVASDQDCDDDDAAVHPEATEIWYDDIDQDCDGNDDDQDGDGYGVDDDCDDLDAALHEDCTGPEDTGAGPDTKRPGCSSVPKTHSGRWLGLALLAVLGRRRSRLRR